jgi:DNA-binding response OmpR family regulator
MGWERLALVIEDDHAAAEILRVQLVAIGFRVIVAETAERGIELAVQQRPDLITLDIHLPGMDGWQCLERLKKNTDVASIPVVIISIVADRARGLSLGANQVLQKPVSRDQLSRALGAEGFGRRFAERHGVVLVIDYDPKAVQLLGTHLDVAGYKVLSAFNGRQGINIARESKPDLILLDLMMPELSGFDVIDALKNDVTTRDIPIIVVTAKQITQADRDRLGKDAKEILEKSDLRHGLFIREVDRAMLKDKVDHA